MIIYRGGSFGFGILLRLHGSAITKALIPAAVSTCILIVVTKGLGYGMDENEEERWISNTYAIGALIAFFTFLITFRANFAYNRYWEACTAVHHMIARWADLGMEMASFHYQCAQYDDIRPPPFGKHPELRNLSRERDRKHQMSAEEMEDQIDQYLEDNASLDTMSPLEALGIRIKKKRRQKAEKTKQASTAKSINSSNTKSNTAIPLPERNNGSTSSSGAPQRGLTRLKSKAVINGGLKTPTPSLFLQEGAHLLSLLAAVAMSTLRNDIEGTESPLIEYIPGSPWPPVDPDKLSSEIREQYHERSRVFTAIYFLLGLTRSDKNQTLYNAARPFRVLGGVSDAEVQLLQAARGPSAKVGLVTMWLQEFVSREYQAGSTGGVAPPIISRLYHMTSEGMVGYNQARKIAYIPFPFPHAQLTALFTFVIIVFFPVLMYGYVNNLAAACVLNFFTVLCFVGLHEVARELENPFRNVPNDIPLTTFQAQFNEALLTMYAGFHPDSWWEAPKQPQGRSGLGL